MKTNNINYLELPSVQFFVAMVERFCAVIEQQEQYTPYEFVREAASTLAGLFHGAIELPEPPESKTVQHPAFNEQVVTRDMHEAIMTKLDGHNHYRWIADPFNMNEKPGTIGISTWLLETYEVIKRGLNRYQTADDLDGIWDAFEHWYHTFDIDWGMDLMNALKPIGWLATEFGIKPVPINKDDDLE